MLTIVEWREWVGARPVVLVVGLVALTIGAWLLRRDGGPRERGLIRVLGVAYVAQAALAIWIPLGLALYLLAIALFVAWDRPPRTRPSRSLSIPISISIFTLIVVLAGLARFWELGDVPYGIDGDEALWSAKTAFYLSTGRTIADAHLRFRYTPVSYFSEGLFFKLLGPSFWAARVQVATFSVLGVAFFALGAAALWGARAGLAAGALLAVSLVDVAMGRVALVESQIALPVGLSVFFLGLALRCRAFWFWFLLTGVMLGLGALTFETFYPLAGVVALYALFCALRSRTHVRALSLLLLLAPLALLYPLLSEHVRVRRDDHNKSSMSLLEPGLSAPQILRRAVTNVGDVLYNFYQQRFGDFGVHREGPIINGALVPLLVLGLAYLLPRWQSGPHLFLLLWLGLTLFPVPVLFGSPWVRVMFPAFPAMYAVIALFVVDVGGELLPAGAGLLFLAALALVNASIYRYEFIEPAERVKRRELYDLVSQHSGPGKMLFLLYWDGMGDFVEWEHRGLPLAAAVQVPLGRVGEVYRFVPFDALLPLTELAADSTQLTLIFDHTLPQYEFPARQARLQAWLDCYPGALVEHSPSFTVYTLDRAALASPVCRGAFPPLLSLAWSGATPTLSWEPPQGQTALRPACERLRDDVAAWVEAESLSHPGGWRVVWPVDAFVEGSGYLADQWQAGEAWGEAHLAGAHTLTAWVHTYHHDMAAGPVTVQVGETVLPALDASRPQEGWAWQRLGELRLPGGELTTTLHVRRDYTGYHAPFFLDAFLFSRNTSFDPNAASPWETVLEGPTSSSTEGVYALERAAAWPAGVYRCRLRLFGAGLVDSLGEAGVWSSYADLRIEE
jgi:4-amino-4-deoxy-L-arabinose transferase-like glycosyltransferase